MRRQPVFPLPPSPPRLVPGRAAADGSFEAAEATALRYAVEREIEAVAQHLAALRSRLPLLLERLAGGRFEIGPASRLAALEQTLREFGGRAAVDVELRFAAAVPARAMVGLDIERSAWCWSAPAGCRVLLPGGELFRLPADDALVAALLAGLAFQGGWALAFWARSLSARKN